MFHHLSAVYIYIYIYDFAIFGRLKKDKKKPTTSCKFVYNSEVQKLIQIKNDQ